MGASEDWTERMAAMATVSESDRVSGSGREESSSVSDSESDCVSECGSECVSECVSEGVRDISTSLNNSNITNISSANTTKKIKKKKKKKKKKKSEVGTEVGADSFFVTEEMDVLSTINSPEAIDIWHRAYREAFAKENEFMDNTCIDNSQGQGQGGSGKSSQALGLSGAAMMPLVFIISAKDALRFRRVCFCVRETGTVPLSSKKNEQNSSDCLDSGKKTLVEKHVKSDIVGYATVDEDILQPNGVCHIRMILVVPSHQRRGIGKQLLHHIENRFRHRHLGLKYANCHDYRNFYESAGFQVIGIDALYTYMAIKR